VQSANAGGLVAAAPSRLDTQSVDNSGIVGCDHRGDVNAEQNDLSEEKPRTSCIC